MTLGTATLLLLLALGSIAACRVCLRKKRSLRRACVAALSVLALALIVYSDLDVSVIDQLPPGRQPIETFAGVKNKKRQQALRLLPFAARKSHLANGGSGCYNRENS